MPVPLLDVNAQNHPLEAEFKAAFERVFRSGQFIMGPELTAFEAEVGQLIGTKNAIGVSSGTDAILLALMALEIKPGDEVLCPSFTFFATAGCIARAGARPVFVDSDPATFNINVADARRKVTPRTKAIVPVHLFGQCADMGAVMALAQETGLHVIEDAAQSLGATWQGHGAGTMGAFGTYSFFPSKNLGGFGDGGLLVAKTNELAEYARLLRTHGAKPKYYHKHVGANFRLDPLQAAFLRVKLPHYNRYTAGRQANAAYYTEKLKGLPGVILPTALPGNGHIWNQYTLRLTGPGRRDALKDFLTARGIGTEIYYPVPMHQQECFAYLGQQNGLPNASTLANEVISIPIYAELPRPQQDEVIRALTEFLTR